MRMSSLRSVCERRLAGIPVPQPFDLRAFAEVVADYRGRPVHIHELPGLDGTDGFTGAWLPKAEEDVIFIDADASGWHKSAIGAHEFAHLLCDHQESARPLKELFKRLMPDLGDEALRRMLGRHGRYTVAEEREAEMTACLILDRADADPLPAWYPGPPGIAGRLAHVLRHPVRHG